MFRACSVLFSKLSSRMSSASNLWKEKKYTSFKRLNVIPNALPPTVYISLPILQYTEYKPDKPNPKQQFPKTK